VHPITAVQMEWSLWTRDIEEEIIPLCRFVQFTAPVFMKVGLTSLLSASTSKKPLKNAAQTCLSLRDVKIYFRHKIVCQFLFCVAF
jgi:aryl-alcohol dehydrogenase-like predicted oxidoreductase